MEVADTYYKSKWNIFFSLIPPNAVNVRASDEDGWHEFIRTFSSSKSRALSEASGEIVDLFQETYNRAFDRFVYREEGRINRLIISYDLIFVEQLPTVFSGVECFNTPNALATWNLEYIETSNLVWLLVATDLDGRMMKIQDFAVDPNELIKKMVNNIINFQLLVKPTKNNISDCGKANLGSLIMPFNISIRMNFNLQPPASHVILS